MDNIDIVYAVFAEGHDLSPALLGVHRTLKTADDHAYRVRRRPLDDDGRELSSAADVLGFTGVCVRAMRVQE